MTKGITAGCFDLLHAGHCMMLEEARSHCDHLTVLLQTDPSIDRPDTKESPTQSLPEREIQLKAIRWVDDVKIYQTEKELVELLTLLKPDVRIIGADYKDKPFTGDDLPIEVVYNSRDHAFSTTELKQRIRGAPRPITHTKTFVGKTFEEQVDEQYKNMNFMNYVYNPGKK
tara:strand:+ start:143 stop:655 length:513 start_codon:yes stop_codon:yes gene_type:complete